jgi:hypothetical protein
MKESVAFLKKSNQKTFAPEPAILKTIVPLGQKFFAELFFKKATASS